MSFPNLYSFEKYLPSYKQIKNSQLPNVCTPIVAALSVTAQRRVNKIQGPFPYQSFLKSMPKQLMIKGLQFGLTDAVNSALKNDQDSKSIGILKKVIGAGTISSIFTPAFYTGCWKVANPKGKIKGLYVAPVLQVTREIFAIGVGSSGGAIFGSNNDSPLKSFTLGSLVSATAAIATHPTLHLPAQRAAHLNIGQIDAVKTVYNEISTAVQTGGVLKGLRTATNGLSFRMPVIVMYGGAMSVASCLAKD